MSVLLGLIMATTSYVAQDTVLSSEQVKAIKACVKIEDSTKRLGCYDKALGVVKKASTVRAARVPTVPTIVAKQVPVDQQVSKEDGKKLFGKAPGTLQPAIPDELTLSVSEVLKTKSGKYIFKMTDGSRWIQRDTRYFKKKKAPFEVVIRKGFAGSYNLTHTDSSRTIKVKRID